MFEIKEHIYTENEREYPRDIDKPLGGACFRAYLQRLGMLWIKGQTSDSLEPLTYSVDYWRGTIFQPSTDKINRQKNQLHLTINKVYMRESAD